MQVRIAARHGTLSQATQARIATKLEKLRRVFGRLVGIEVTVHLERRDKPTVDVRVSAEHKHDFVASYCSDDLFGAVDQVVHKLEQQLRRYKQKIQEHHRSA
ncbi:MAG: ribosome hibernation-promoting factor, HPF/YfiA family [Thermoguttaceae bacterium]